MDEKVKKQLEFILELDKLKKVERKNRILDESRNENTAEHSWHSIMMAIIFAEYGNENVDLFKVIQMIAVHDIVEIYAGDTFFFDEKANQDKYQRESEAIKKLTTILPNENGDNIKSIWFEFEHQETMDSIFANAIDQIMPVILNANSNGLSWTENNITAKQVEAKLSIVKKASPKLWELLKNQINISIDKNILS